MVRFQIKFFSSFFLDVGCDVVIMVKMLYAGLVLLESLYLKSQVHFTVTTLLTIFIEVGYGIGNGGLY